jgi:hypothetical protein
MMGTLIKGISNGFELFLRHIIIRCEKKGIFEWSETTEDGKKIVNKSGAKVYALACYHHSCDRYKVKEAVSHEFFLENCVGCYNWLGQVKEIIENKRKHVSVRSRPQLKRYDEPEETERVEEVDLFDDHKEEVIILNNVIKKAVKTKQRKKLQ